MDIRNGDNVYVAMASGTPFTLLEMMYKLNIRDVSVYHLLTFGELKYIKNERFRHISLFTHHNTRDYVNQTDNYIPVNFSQIPKLIRSKKIPIDVVLIEVSEPNDLGYCSLGMSVECLPAAIISANRVIACVNKNVPKTYGYQIHINQISELHYIDKDIFLYEDKSFPSSEENEVAHRVSELIPSNCTVQTGVGAIPSLVLYHLQTRENIKIHTECFFDASMNLMLSGAAIEAKCTLAMGTQKLIDFLHNNNSVEVLDVEKINDPRIISDKNIYAINSSVSLDLLGQASCDYVGNNIYSGFGGILDFMRGASYGSGLAILAMTSRTKKSQSKICKRLNSPVTLTRADIDFIVTEYGTVDLRGTTSRDRCFLIKEIAHPDDRINLFS
jgi:4-hydroxybutyrate CoA-transferase